MSKLVLYGVEVSPPVRAVRMLLKELGLSYEFKIVDMEKGEHKTGELSKHHPNPTVPALQDGDAWLLDSHAISCYLVDKYAKSDDLYPKDLVKRAIVDERLFFNGSMLFMSLRFIVKGIFVHKDVVLTEPKINNVVEGYTALEKILSRNKFIAGNTFTIADLLCLSTVSSADAVIAIDAAKFPSLTSWYGEMKKLPYFEELNGAGIKFFKDVIKAMLKEE